MIDRAEVVISTEGEAGEAAGTASLFTRGHDPAEILGIKITYSEQPETTTVKVSDREGLNGDVLSVAGNEDKTYRPQSPTHNSEGAVIEGWFAPFCVDGLDVSVSGADAGGTVTVEVYFEL